MYRVMVYTPSDNSWREWFRSESERYCGERARAMNKTLPKDCRAKVVAVGERCEQRKGA